MNFFARLFISVLISQNIFAASGAVDILLKSAVTVKVFSPLKDINLEKAPFGYMINRVVISALDLSVTPAAAKGNLHSSKFLNSDKYPQIVVSNVKCVIKNKTNLNEEGNCTGNLGIKGQTRPITTARFSVLNKELRITFTFSISSYGIADKVFLFKIDDSAQAVVRIGL